MNCRKIWGMNMTKTPDMADKLVLIVENDFLRKRVAELGEDNKRLRNILDGVCVTQCRECSIYFPHDVKTCPKCSGVCVINIFSRHEF